MKSFSKLLAGCLVVLLLVSGLAACGGGDVTTTGTTTTAPGGTTVVPDADSLAMALMNAKYKIIAPQNTTPNEVSACGIIENAVNALTGKEINVTDDYVKRNQTIPANNLEILVGNTNRASSKALKAALQNNRINADRDWQIVMTNQEVVICGGTDVGTLAAANAFAAMLAGKSADYSLETYDSGIQEYAWEITTIGGANAGDFVIVIAAEPTETVQTYAASVQSAFYEKTGFRPEIVTDASAATDAEILLGKTNRTESQALVTLLDEHRKNNVYDYRIKASGAKLAVVAGSEMGLADAVTYFNQNGILSDVSALDYSFVSDAVHNVSLGGADASAFQIVIAQDAGIDVKEMALQLHNFFWANGYDVAVVTDAVAETEREILLGKTNRDESAAAEIDAYTVSFKNKKLVVDAGHYYGVTLALGQFLEAYAEATTDITVADNYTLNGEVEIPLTFTPDSASLTPLLNRLNVTDYHNGTYVLAWNDEFDGAKLNLDKWSGRTCMWLDDQRLTMEEGIVDVIDGKMVLTSVKNDPADGYTEKYSTGYSVATADTMNFQYGYVEMEGELPYYGAGEWPSFWIQGRGLLSYEDWMQENNRRPHYFVEVDILEVFSNPNTLYCNLHKWYYSYSEHYVDGRPNDMIDNSTGANKNGTGARTYSFGTAATARKAHKYGYLWTEEFMAFSIDGEFYYAYDLRDDFGRASGMEDYTQPQFLIINNQFYTEKYFENRGSSGTAIQDAILPLTYKVNYVRLYQLPGYGKLYTTAQAGTGVLVNNDQIDPTKVVLPGEDAVV